MILVLTNEEDLTTDFVVRELHRDEFVRVNTERLGQHGELTYEFDERGTVVTVGNEGRRLRAEKITAVYCRRNGVPEPHGDIDDPGVRAFARSEFAALIDALAHLITAHWINHPHAVRRAEAKPLQLATAQRCGLLVPRTAITNDPAHARAFAERETDGVILKALTSPKVRIDGREHIMFTSLLPAEQLSILEDVRLAPCIVQQHIPKAADIRVTVVGKDVFAVEIDSQSIPRAVVDWRAASDLPHRIHRLPGEVAASCAALCETLGLTFGALDFVLDRGGNYVFLEVNPSGQWAWLELLTGVPIAASLANSLRGS